MEVNARHFVEARSEEDIKTLMNFRHMVRMPILYLGGGSNLLFLRDFEGLVVRINSKGIKWVDHDHDEVLVTAQAGENWDDFVHYCIQNGWAGLENLSLIPGTVGAAPIQNIGAYGVEVGEFIEHVHVMEVQHARQRWITNPECRFGYRDSIFKKDLKGKVIVMSVTFRLKRFALHLSHPEQAGAAIREQELLKHPVSLRLDYGDIRSELKAMQVEVPAPGDVRNAVIAIRRRKLPDPAVIGNAGSFFKNPVITVEEFERLQREFPGIPGYSGLQPKTGTISDPDHEQIPQPSQEHIPVPAEGVGEFSPKNVKVPAAWLIDQCGWKGYRRGDAGVHQNQPLVLVNYGIATGTEIAALAREILTSVKEKFGIDLEFEVNILG